MSVLDQKLEALASYPRLDPENVRRFGDALRGLDDWGSLRINPFAFAAEHGFAEPEALDLFVHGAKVGLFDFDWNLLCPLCGAYVINRGSVNSLEPLAHCGTCAADVEGTLDDQVEVGFSLSPSAGRVEIDPYADAESYRRYVFSPGFRRSPDVEALIETVKLGFALVGPDEEAHLELDAAPGESYRLVSVERNVSATLEAADDGRSEVELDLVDAGLFPATTVVAPGRVAVAIRNRSKRPAGVDLFRLDPSVREAIHADPPTIDRFLTGKLLLNDQSFRDLFRVQQLVPGLHLPLRSLTLLFTDLKGSTALYDRAGDAYAFELVRAHYDELAGAVRANSGAVIKTMGDAIMASFSRPLDAARAAVEMVERIDRLNRSVADGEHMLGLKVGLHEGPALAVNADDRLDYFGQTVNVAARVQALAEAGEIWHTDRLGCVAGVAELLGEHGFVASEHSVSLKGVGAPVLVHQWRPAQ